MATCENHCEWDNLKFGKHYEEVHKWLDQFCGVELYRTKHRRVRHHEQEIREAVRIFGKYAEAFVRQHIVIDLKEEGWKESDHFPEDELDYVKMRGCGSCLK